MSERVRAQKVTEFVVDRRLWNPGDKSDGRRQSVPNTPQKPMATGRGHLNAARRLRTSRTRGVLIIECQVRRRSVR